MKKVMTYWLMILALVMASVLMSCGEGVTETGNPTTGNTDGTDTGDSSGEDDSSAGDDGDTASGPDSDTVDEEQACLDEGGEFVEFSDGCADFCDTDADSICTQAITESCDCGDGFCWNADTFTCDEDL